MSKSLCLWLAGALTIATASCSTAPVNPAPLSAAERELASRLPACYATGSVPALWLGMSSFVEMDDGGHEVTVREKLAKLGAYPGIDGKIYDRSGREIRFWLAPAWGTAPPANYQADDLKELQKNYTVIILGNDPRLPGPC